MKKFISCIVLVFVAFSVFAQDGLKGSWVLEESAMGMNAIDKMVFSDDRQGTVEESMRLIFDISMMGTKISGEADYYMNGTFKYDGTKLVIKWNKDSFRYDIAKPIVATRKGETITMDNKDLQEEFDKLAEEMKKEGEKGSVYDSAQVSSKKLVLKSTGKDGKTETEKYTRIQ